MKNVLNRIADKTRSDKKLKFTSLAHHITPGRLEEGLRGISPRTAEGIDGKTKEEVKKTLKEWAPQMINAIHEGGYKPPASKRVYLPKPGKEGARRAIAVPTVTDRVLQRATAQILNAIYEQDFLDCSFGGRPKRSAHNAIARLHRVISTRKVNWVMEVDLKNFFGSLNHGWVKRMMKERIGDPRILKLIKKWLEAGVVEKGQWQKTEQGTVQGGPISVLISNVYLHYVLDLWIEKVVKKRMKGEMYYIRYLDDCVPRAQRRIIMRP